MPPVGGGVVGAPEFGLFGVVEPGEVVPGEVVPEGFVPFGLVVPGVVVPGVVVPGVPGFWGVVSGAVPVAGGVPLPGGGVAVPAGGVAVLPGGVAVPAGGVAVLPGGVAALPGAVAAPPGAVVEPGVELCPAVPAAPDAAPPDGAVCATTQVAHKRTREASVSFVIDIWGPQLAIRKPIAQFGPANR